MLEVAGFLHLQPGENFFRQRLIPEAEKFEVLYLFLLGFIPSRSSSESSPMRNIVDHSRSSSSVKNVCAISANFRTVLPNLTGEADVIRFSIGFVKCSRIVVGI